MDELKIVSGWARKLVANAVQKELKKIGWPVDIDLQNLYISIDDTTAHITLHAKGDMPKEVLEKLIDGV